MLSILKEYVRVKYNKPGKEAYLGLNCTGWTARWAARWSLPAPTKAAARLSKSIQTRDMRRTYRPWSRGAWQPRGASWWTT